MLAMGKFRSVFQRKWLVLLTAFYAYGTSVGLITNLSVLYVEWLSAYGRSKAETAIIQSVCNGVCNISGIFSGILVTRFGSRKVGTISAFISAMGLVLSYFATSVTYLIIVFGITTGIGSSGMYVAIATLLGQYFEGRQKHMALSIMSFGTGVGGIFFTYTLNVFSLKYGWKGCMLVVGGIVLQNVPLFALCKPKQTIHNRKGTEIQGEKKSEGSAILPQLKELSKMKLFYLSTFGLCCIVCALLSSLIIVIDVFQFKGFSRDESVVLYLIMAITGTISRLVPGLLKQIPHLSIFAIALFHTVVGTVALLLFPVARTFAMTGVLMGCIGFSLAGTLGSVVHITIIKTTGTKCFSLALGITMTVLGMIRMIGGPITGFFRDITGSYDVSFYYNGGTGACGVICYMILLYLHTSTDKHTEDEQFSSVPTQEEIVLTVDSDTYSNTNDNNENHKMLQK